MRRCQILLQTADLRLELVDLCLQRLEIRAARQRGNHSHRSYLYHNRALHKSTPLLLELSAPRHTSMQNEGRVSRSHAGGSPRRSHGNKFADELQL